MIQKILRGSLEKSNTFDEFRKGRPFRFLHLFSGETDQLGASIKAEARKARLEVYVEALDRKKDPELNLARPATYDEIDRSVGTRQEDHCRFGAQTTSMGCPATHPISNEKQTRGH